MVRTLLVSRFGVLFSSLLAALALSCGGGHKVCSDAACLDDALAHAGTGATVELKSGTFEGSFTIPAGVSLVGAGATTVIKNSGTAPTLLLTAEGKGSSIRGLVVQGGCNGIVITGSGTVELSDLAVTVSCGIGVLVQKLSSIKAVNLQLSGNVTEDIASGIQAKPDETRNGTAGLVLTKVGTADLKQITAKGFASYGVLLYETSGTLDTGEVHDLVGAGLQVAGNCRVNLKSLSAHDIWGGATPFGYGLVVSDGAYVTTEGCTLQANKTAGLLVDHATGDHHNLVVSDNPGRGVCVQECTPAMPGQKAVTFSGSSTRFNNNAGVAFDVIKSQSVSLSDAQLNGTTELLLIPYATPSSGVLIGDGIEMVASTELEFTNLTLDSNARAGVLVDGGGEVSSVQVTFDNVTISGNGQRGYEEQNCTATSKPDVSSDTLRQADLQGGMLDAARGIDFGNIPNATNIIDVGT